MRSQCAHKSEVLQLCVKSPSTTVVVVQKVRDDSVDKVLRYALLFLMGYAQPNEHGLEHNLAFHSSRARSSAGRQVARFLIIKGS